MSRTTSADYETLQANLRGEHRRNDIAPPACSKNSFTVKPSTDLERLNKTERAYLAYLNALGLPWVGVQCLTLKLAEDCRLTPDFEYIATDGRFWFVDVKGFQREDALIKMRVAARQFAWASFVIVKKDGTGWAHQEVKP